MACTVVTGPQDAKACSRRGSNPRHPAYSEASHKTDALTKLSYAGVLAPVRPCSMCSRDTWGHSMHLGTTLQAHMATCMRRGWVDRTTPGLRRMVATIQGTFCSMQISYTEA